MKETFRQKQSRKDREENKRKKGCFHDADHWCGNCINFGIEVDWRKEGLGRGHIITNIPLDLSH